MIASDVNKRLSMKAESVYGQPAGASGAQKLRRADSTLDLSKDMLRSNEVRTTYMAANMRHGVQRVSGTINGELSPGTYAPVFAEKLKREFTAVAALTGLSLTIGAPTDGVYPITRGTGSWLTDGVKRGRVCRFTAGSFTTSNAGKNLFIVNVTANILYVMVANQSGLVAEGPIAAATVSFPGKVTYVPTSGHTDKSWNFEHYYSDLDKSELFVGCKSTQIAIGLPPTGQATIGIGVVGQRMIPQDGPYFTSPADETTTGVLSAVNGFCVMDDDRVQNLTGAQITIAENRSGEPVVGSNFVPHLHADMVSVTGQLTAHFDSTDLRDAFLNETNKGVYLLFTESEAPDAGFVAMALPKVKLNGSSKSGRPGITQTIPFESQENVEGSNTTGTERTNFAIQDSAA
jgi:hypothetical protein